MSVGSQPDYRCFIDRVNDVKVGNLIGVDKYGNRYYEDKKHFFFGESPDEHDYQFSGGFCSGCSDACAVLFLFSVSRQTLKGFCTTCDNETVFSVKKCVQHVTAGWSTPRR